MRYIHKILLKIFNTAKVEYEDALKKPGYNVDLKYTNNKSEKQQCQSKA